jgi:mono/diheme cytochrome c family protein
MNKILKFSLLALGGVAVAMQFVRPDFTNPPVVQEPAWDSPATRALAQRACFDCHSNQTVQPWYAQVAPVSWLLADHIKEGREHLNFSAVDGTEEPEEMAEEILKGAMPTADYKFMHPEARLSPEERDSLVRGLYATFGAAPTDDSVGEVAVSREAHEAQEGKEDNEEH